MKGYKVFADSVRENNEYKLVEGKEKVKQWINEKKQYAIQITVREVETNNEIFVAKKNQEDELKIVKSVDWLKDILTS